MMTPHERNNLVSALEKALEAAKTMPVQTSCKTCGYYDVSNNRCKMWKELVPEEVIETGCEKYQFDKLSPPF